MVSHILFWCCSTGLLSLASSLIYIRLDILEKFRIAYYYYYLNSFFLYRLLMYPCTQRQLNEDLFLKLAFSYVFSLPICLSLSLCTRNGATKVLVFSWVQKPAGWLWDNHFIIVNVDLPICTGPVWLSTSHNFIYNGSIQPEDDNNDNNMYHPPA